MQPDNADWTWGLELKNYGFRVGLSVATTGDTVVVGASVESSNDMGVNGAQNNNSAGNSGAAYISHAAAEHGASRPI